ncbi:hypothetical protein E3J61_01915 [Candidatus Dependentiae bacterium]|nr:MAG: hypothetical protein E3J61_01915 [Candidatus Dependentiae bacterium]
MKDNNALVVTIALFVALLFLSSTASERNLKAANRPAFWGSAPEPKQAIKKRRSTKGLHERFNRFSENRNKIDNDIAEKKRQIRRGTGSKKESYKRQLRRLQQRRDRLTRRIDQISTDIERIEGTK